MADIAGPIGSKPLHRNSISLCMIVRDAEESVGRAIKSALAIVDEVVVVDTGSVDNTRLIVEGYGARVIEYRWADDFAAARNVGIDAAYGDWILVLDADEVLEPIRPVEIGRMLSDDRALAYFAEVLESGASVGLDRVRLFRNNPQARYRFPVHERVAPALAEIALEQAREFRPSRLRVQHHAGDDVVAQARRARNLRLLNRALEQHPDEPWFRYQLAREYTVVHEERMLPVKGFARTLDLLGTAVGQARAESGPARDLLGYLPDLYCRYASGLLTAGRTAEAMAVAEEAQLACGERSRLTFVHARALIQRAEEIQDPRERDALLTIASAHLEALLRVPTDRRRKRRPGTDRYRSAYPLLQLGHVEFARKDLQAAGEHYRAAMRACPDYTAALGGLARIARAEGRVHEALQIYLKVIAVDNRDIDAWVGGAQTQIELGFTDNARSWLGRLEQVMPEHPGLGNLLAQLSTTARPAHAGS